MIMRLDDNESQFSEAQRADICWTNYIGRKAPW